MWIIGIYANPCFEMGLLCHKSYLTLIDIHFLPDMCSLAFADEVDGPMGVE